MKSLQLLMLMLPPSHRIVAQHLLQLLSLVASAATRSKMDARNLALVFAPTLFLSADLKTQVCYTQHTLQSLSGAIICVCITLTGVLYC